MSFYNMLFGMNPNTDIVLALIGLKQCDIQRFRDCWLDGDNGQVVIYTRTGSGNREDYPNTTLTSNPYYLRDVDDEFDSTYATYYFKVPPVIAEDVKGLCEPTKHGLTANLLEHILRTLGREPNENDKQEQARKKQQQVVQRLLQNHEAVVWNGHTVVPLSDSGMEELLRVAEENDGEFTAYWGIKPLKFDIETNSFDFAVSKEDDLRRNKHRILISAPRKWEVDTGWWNRWKLKFSDKYPKAMSRIAEGING